MGRVLVWYSDGAASAVAAKIAVKKYPPPIQLEILKCDTSADEHPDNIRFRREVEQWIGVPIKLLRHHKYSTIEAVWRGEKYVAGIHGATCTRILKRQVREAYQRDGDRHVFGFTLDERSRIEEFEDHHRDLLCEWVLANAGITKEDCYKILDSVGIELPAMYKLGYRNNNCIGCCKGGMGYWNKIRGDFPDIFESRKDVFVELGVKPFRRKDGSRFGLDELEPGMGRDEPMPDIECGMFCGMYSQMIDDLAKCEV